MDLEKKVGGNNLSFFKRILRRAAPYVVAGLVASPTIGCKESPGPISVENTITPSTVQSGSNIYLEVEVTNYGGEVTIEEVSARERVISGWAAGQEASANLPVTNYEIDAHRTETIFSRSAPVLNIPPYGTPLNIQNITFEMTVTVESDGGDDSDVCTYTVTPAYTYSSSSSRQAESEKESTRAGGIVQALSEK